MTAKFLPIDAVLLHEIALVLENEGNFYASYKARAPRYNNSERRSLIWSEMGSMRTKMAKTKAGEGASIEQLRRYFDDIWDIPANDPRQDTSTVAMDDTFEFWLDRVKYPPAQPINPCKEMAVKDDFYDAISYALTKNGLAPKPTQPEPTMSTPITVTTQTLVNGKNIADMEDSAIYALIAGEEAKIRELEAIEAKPKRLQNEIAKRKAGIAALVAHLDSKEEA